MSWIWRKCSTSAAIPWSPKWFPVRAYSQSAKLLSSSIWLSLNHLWRMASSTFTSRSPTSCRNKLSKLSGSISLSRSSEQHQSTSLLRLLQKSPRLKKVKSKHRRPSQKPRRRKSLSSTLSLKGQKCSRRMAIKSTSVGRTEHRISR